MSRRPTGTAASLQYEVVRTAVRQLAMALTLTVGLLPCLASAANKDLVILNSERWIDTLKGTVKNVSAGRAEEVVIVVRFFGEPAVAAPTRHQRRSARRMELGQQTARLAALDPGQEAPFEVEIAEKHRKATSYKFDPHAIWRKRARDRAEEH